MNIFVLDGYNVIYAVPELRRKLDRSLEAARSALLTLCSSLNERRGDISQIYVVFDGNEEFAHVSAYKHASVRVMFTRKKEEADDRILSLIRRDGSKNSFTIISNDNYVFNNSKAHGARVISVAQFLELVEKPERQKNPKRNTEAPVKILPLDKAKQITDEYRKHLGI